MNAPEILKAMRADSIPDGDGGLWLVRKCKHPVTIPHTTFMDRPDLPDSKRVVPAGIYTGLFVMTEETMMKYPGECVMEDSKPELSKHLEFIRLATGRCLVSGLGLGCVVRGLIANGKVSSITVLEKSRHVLRMVAPHMPKHPSLKIRHADARKWIQRDRTVWDCAWHDCWTDKKEGHLAILHQHLMLDLLGRCRLQGAWHFPRECRRVLNIKFGHMCRFI